MAALLEPTRIGRGQIEASEEEADGPVVMCAVRPSVVPPRCSTAADTKGVLHPARSKGFDLAGARLRPVTFGLPVLPDTETSKPVPTETIAVEASVPSPVGTAIPEPPVKGVQVGLDTPDAFRAVLIGSLIQGG